MRQTVGRRLLALLALAWAGPAAAADFTTTVAPVFKEFCLKCHGGDKPKGDLSLETLAADFAKNGETWKTVLEHVSDGSMPPKEKPQPSAGQRRAVSEWIASGLVAQAKVFTAANGRARLKRLNRVEYINTMRDLLGAEIDPEELPEDGIASGFDNVDAALDLSSSLLGSYLEAIDVALGNALSPGKRPKTTTQRVDYPALGKLKTKTNRPMPRLGTSTIVKEQEVIFVSAAMIEKPVVDALADTPGLYRFRMRANTVNTGKPLTLLIYTGNYGRGVQGLLTRPVAMVDVPAATTTVEFTVPLLAHETIKMLPYGMGNVYTDAEENHQLPGMALQWIEVEGPLIDAWPPEPTKRLLGEFDLAKASAADAEKVLRAFATRAFRRPVQDAELQPYLDLIKTRLDKGYSVAAALRVGLTGVLSSPDFLYLSATPGRLNDYDLASRLAYFLWSTMPDDTLIALAKRGELGKPAVLRQQVERLLNDARAHRFTENFVGQWLSLRNLKATIPDKKVYPDFDDWLLHSMPLETYSFFEEILRHDRPVTEFLHADWSMLNERLAKLYGIPGVNGSEFRKVSLPAGSHRGGVLTQAAVLKVTANGTTTSPVVRGAWVLDHLLGTPPPPPPKDVPAIEPDIRGAKTMREQLEKHRSIERCAGCHAKIDPLGNALENFDVIGGWREYYRTVPGNGRSKVMIKTFKGLDHPVGKGLDVDAKDELPDGRKFTSVDELKQFLLADSDQVARALGQKLLVYATGHRLEFADRASVDALLASSKPSHYGFRTLIHELVQSPAFRTK
ncbi:MAG: DUF1592 domain-containing protein [Verrucomicrobia bacterium]|nr:DUF1592 domain-containing protein [Verrucomicrobiota bacterium]